MYTKIYQEKDINMFTCGAADLLTKEEEEAVKVAAAAWLGDRSPSVS